MVTTSSLLALGALLFVKHLLADGPLQTDHQVAHKGEFLHPAGLIHSFNHAAITVVCMVGWIFANGWAFTVDMMLLFSLIGLGEFLIHYFCDLTKVRIDRRYEWSVTEDLGEGRFALKITSSMFFFAFLADQTVHSLTYVLILYVVGIVL